MHKPKSKSHKVAHLSSVHQASDTRVFQKECRSLAAAGYDVVLIARADKDTVSDGVTIKGVRRKGQNRLIRRILAIGDVLVKGIRERADLYHFHDPELIPVGIVLKALRKRVVYDSHEHTQHFMRTQIPGMPSWLRAPFGAAFGAFERLGARIFDGVIVTDRARIDYFRGANVCLVENFALTGEFAVDKVAPYSDREPIVAYIGGLTTVRGLREMVDAIEEANGESSATLSLGGGFRQDGLQEQAEGWPGWKYVEFLGHLSRSAVFDLLGKARIGIVVLHPIPNYVNSQPVKLLEYMLAGLPVVCSDFPYYRQYVEENDCGILVDPLDISAISGAIKWLLDHPEEAENMGQRGRKAVLEKYSWESQTDKLLAFYRDIIRS